MDKITLEEMIEYSKEVVYYYRNKYNLSNDEKDTMVTRTREIKSKLYDDWCKRFDSVELAKFCLRAILADKDEWSRDDEIYLEELLNKDTHTRYDIVYDLEATMLSILQLRHTDIKYF
nr:MAG TPA: hypothetical protein [Caudoviricetes sp.]